jgi:hypothetical protein
VLCGWNLLLSTAQQVGGATGRAVLGTVAWTVLANRLQSQTAHAARAAAAAGRSGRTVTGGPAGTRPSGSDHLSRLNS